jgi:OOP family OmpA-OmpF porin
VPIAGRAFDFQEIANGWKTDSTTMTESATPAKPQVTKTPPSPGWGVGLLVLIFRVLLLGVSGSLAFLLGIAIASIFPGTVADPPWVETAARRSSALLRQVRVGETPAPPTTSISVPTETEVSPETPVSSDAPTLPGVPEAPPGDAPAESLPPLDLSESEREQLEAELADLEANLAALRDRTAALSIDLGLSADLISLEQRIQQLRQRLDPDAPAPEPSDFDTLDPDTPVSSPPETQLDAPLGAAPSAPQEDAAEVTSNVQVGPRLGYPAASRLTVTLPVDVLFAPGQSTLQAQNTSILDSVVADLLQYPGTAVYVAAHGDGRLSPVESRMQSFEQAKAVRDYLAAALGDASYHWVVVGYGQNFPVADNATAANRQRNRRLEITVSDR